LAVILAPKSSGNIRANELHDAWRRAPARAGAGHQRATLAAYDMEWLSMLSSTAPSEWARNLVRGAYDLHVHVARMSCAAGSPMSSLPAAAGTRAIADAAVAAGVRHVIATHPDFPQQDMGLDDQLALARQGVFLERCFCPPYTGMCDWTRMVANIRATGPATAIVTTDLGQPDNPPVEDGLALMADALHAAGFTDEEITAMIVDNSRLLAGADALRADPRRM
jgi:hypothetical protein